MMANVRVFSPFYVLLGFVLLTSAACMPKVEEDEVVPVVTIDSAAVSGISTDRRVTLTGKCPLGTNILRVSAEAAEHGIGDAISNSWTASSGKPLGWCRNGAFQIDYPVPNPTTARQITFKIKARLNDGRSSLEWAVRTVAYDNPVLGAPGFAIGAVGATLNSGILQAAGIMVHSIGGEAVGGPNVQTSSQTELRSGVHAVITE